MGAPLRPCGKCPLLPAPRVCEPLRYGASRSLCCPGPCVLWAGSLPWAPGRQSRLGGEQKPAVSGPCWGGGHGSCHSHCLCLADKAQCLPPHPLSFWEVTALPRAPSITALGSRWCRGPRRGGARVAALPLCLGMCRAPSGLGWGMGHDPFPSWYLGHPLAAEPTGAGPQQSPWPWAWGRLAAWPVLSTSRIFAEQCLAGH